MSAPLLFAGPEHEPFALGCGGKRGALLIHGFPGTPAELRPLGEALAERGVDAHGVLLPGFGGQIHDLDQTTRHDWVAGARSAWQELCARYKHVYLVGFSMGATIAAHLAAEHPPTRLVLIAPLWRLFGIPSELGLALPLVGRFLPRIQPFRWADFSAPGTRAYFERMMPDLDITKDEVQQAVREKAGFSTQVIAELWALGATAPRLVRSLRVPTLTIQPLADRTVLPRDTRLLVRQMPAPCQLLEVAGEHLCILPTHPGWSATRAAVLDWCKPAA